MPERLLPELVTLAERAGAVVLEHYEAGADVRTKADRSPVTAADDAAEALIVEALERLTPDIPIVAEERVAAGRVPALDDGPFWLVDPLDGTKEFVSGNGEFTINIALVEAQSPRLGVVLAPALKRAWWGAASAGAMATHAGETRPIRARAKPSEGLVAVASRSHADPETDAFLRDLDLAERISAGSSLKFCLLAEGRADVYPRFGPTMEWDTAAGHAVLLAAGGRITTRDGTPLLYRKPAFKNPGFIAWGA